MPKTAIKAEVGMPDRLLRLMLDGLLDIGVMYTPQLRPGLEVKPLIEDHLVLVSTDPQYPPELDERYVSVEWSPEFVALHAAQYPQMASPRISLGLGSLSVRFLLKNNSAAYFPTRAVEDFVKSGQLHIIADAPSFPFPCYVVWNPEKDSKLINASLEHLNTAVAMVKDNQNKLINNVGLSEVDASLTNQLFEN